MNELAQINRLSLYHRAREELSFLFVFLSPSHGHRSAIFNGKIQFACIHRPTSG